MKTIEGFEKAKGILNQIRDLNFEDLPSNVRLKIDQTFGKNLTPSDVVSLILKKVYSNGDKALNELSYLIVLSTNNLCI